MAKIKTVAPSLAKSTLKAPPALVLKTPAGSSMKAGSNTQPWENTGSYTADQTAAGYGDVPTMSYNTPVIGDTSSLAQYGPSQSPYSYPMSQDALDAGMGAPTAGSSFSDYAGLAQAGISLFNGINSYNLGKKNLSLAKDMFGFEKAATNRNMTNQATEYNTGVQNRGEVGMSLAGNTMDQGARDARQAQLNSYKISTAPIG